MLEVPPDLSDNICMMNERILISADDTIAEVDGVEFQIRNISESDHEGHSWIYLELEDGREFLSYDDGETWTNELDA